MSKVTPTVTENISYNWSTPDGTVTIFVQKENPPQISIFIGKAGTSIAAWAFAVQELVNKLLQHVSMEEVILSLEGITTGSSMLNISSGVECRSTAEAIAFSLLEFSKRKM